MELLILAGLGVWLALALRSCFRRKSGCGGCCGGSGSRSGIGGYMGRQVVLNQGRAVHLDHEGDAVHFYLGLLTLDAIDGHVILRAIDGIFVLLHCDWLFGGKFERVIPCSAS